VKIDISLGWTPALLVTYKLAFQISHVILIEKLEKNVLSFSLCLSHSDTSFE